MARAFAHEAGAVCELHRTCCEEFQLTEGSVDVALTSPPYFNLELYDDAATQSHMRYPDPKVWEVQFLGRMLERVFQGLKPGGFFLLNVASNCMLRKGGMDLEAAAERRARAAGFEIKPSLQMLKPRSLADAAEEAEFKFEPVFVFRKPQFASAEPAGSGREPSSQLGVQGGWSGCGPDQSSAELGSLLDML